jgi:hypothetical protein
MITQLRRICVIGSALIFGACGTGLDDKVNIVASSVTPNPVPAPTAQTPSTFVVAMTVSAKPDYRSAGIRILGLDTNNPSRDYIGVDTGLVGFQLGCGQDICQSGATQRTCTVTLSSAAGGRNRIITCEGTPAGREIVAAKYAYAISVQTQTGTFFGGETAEVAGLIEFQ